MANTQTAGGTSAQPYGMYLPMPAAGHHNMIHQPIHQVESDLAPQVVVGRGGREADNQVHVHATGTQVTFQQIWHNTNNTDVDADADGESPYPNPNSVLDQDQGPASQEDNFDPNVHNYVKDDVSGISFFAD